MPFFLFGAFACLAAGMSALLMWILICPVVRFVLDRRVCPGRILIILQPTQAIPGAFLRCTSESPPPAPSGALLNLFSLVRLEYTIDREPCQYFFVKKGKFFASLSKAPVGTGKIDMLILAFVWPDTPIERG